MAKDLKTFLNKVESDLPDHFFRVKSPVDTQAFEITAAMDLMDRKGLQRITLFESPSTVSGNPGIPFVSNVFATRGLCAYALDMPYEDHGMALVEAFGHIERQPGTVEVVTQPPCQQIVRQGDGVNIRELPIPMHHEKDVGPYFTMTCVMKGLEEDFYDITFTKNWAKSRNRMSVSAHGHHHLARIVAAHEKQNRPTRMIVVLGHHPAFYLSACCLMPYRNNDYETAAAFLGEPLRLAPSVTWGDDFLVPADAEIIVEAEVLPGVRETQNPFGEIAGYYQPPLQLPVAEVKALTMKADAVMQGVFPGRAEHWHLGGIPKEGSTFRAIRKKFPGVTAVHLPPSGCGRFSCVISMQKEQMSDPRRAAMMAFPEVEHLKMVTVVDADVDVFDEREVHWAVVTRTHWDKDIEVIRKVQHFRKWMGDAVIIIDATRPDIAGFPETNKIPPEALAAVKEKRIT